MRINSDSIDMGYYKIGRKHGRIMAKCVLEGLYFLYVKATRFMVYIILNWNEK